MNSMATDHRVSHEWSLRPDDERFLTLPSLSAYVHGRAAKSHPFIIPNDTMKVYASEEGELVLNNPRTPKFFTNWSFGQVAGIAQAPASYLRRLSAPLAAANLNEGLTRLAARDQMQIMLDETDHLRCVTSTQYGRIWDYQVVDGVERVCEGGEWAVPVASYSARNPKRATTLYASDRDMFIFLVDVKHPVEVDGEAMYRGFYTWNSEVGSQTFGLATFLYRTVCDNRIIWGVSHRQEIRIKHTSGAPEKFAREGASVLEQYTNDSPKALNDAIHRAQTIRVGKDEAGVSEWLVKRGFTLAKAKAVIETAKMEEDEYRTPWTLAQGITAIARTIAHTDTRVEAERIAGRLLRDTVGEVEGARPPYLTKGESQGRRG